MTTEISKRTLATGLGAGLGVGALALLAQTQRAAADTPFSNFAFQAAGAPTARTMPDRLAEVKNVKDFGAIGNGVADDTAAIQAAVNWTTGPNRGTIYFPLGQYKVSAPITFNYDGPLSIVFRGDGAASQLVANFPGYVLDRSNSNPTSGGRIIERLWIQNYSSSGGCIRMNGTNGGMIRDCVINGFIGVALAAESYSISLHNVQFSGPGPGAGSGGNTAGSIGLLADQLTNIGIYSCDFALFDHAIRASGIGLSIIGCRFEVNNIGIACGYKANMSTWALTSCLISGGSFESNNIGIYANALGSSHVCGLKIQGGTNAPAGTSIDGIRLHGCSFTLFTGLSLAGGFTNSAIGIDNDWALTFIGCQTSNANGARWQFPASRGGIGCMQCDNPSLAFPYAMLPAVGLEGSEFDITDCSTATWGATAAGGGSNHVRVRYNGTRWTVCAI